MRKVKIQVPEKDDKGEISIFLSHDVSFKFTDKRKASDFVSKLNKFLQETVEDLNGLYIDLYSTFRKYYFTYDRRYELISLQREFDSVALCLDKAVFNSEYQRQNIFVFIDLEKCFSYLHIIIQLQKAFFLHKKNTPERKAMESRSRVLEMINDRFYRLQIEYKNNTEFKELMQLRVA